jgi:hypothetical protein
VTRLIFCAVARCPGSAGLRSESKAKRRSAPAGRKGSHVIILGSLTIGTASAVAVIATLNGWVARLIDTRRMRIIERERRDTVVSVLYMAPPGSTVIEHLADGTCLSFVTGDPASPRCGRHDPHGTAS